jgi:hypothetical protein
MLLSPHVEQRRVARSQRALSCFPCVIGVHGLEVPPRQVTVSDRRGGVRSSGGGATGNNDRFIGSIETVLGAFLIAAA